MTIATPNSSASRCSILKHRPRCCWRVASSPLPWIFFRDICSEKDEADETGITRIPGNLSCTEQWRCPQQSKHIVTLPSLQQPAVNFVRRDTRNYSREITRMIWPELKDAFGDLNCRLLHTQHCPKPVILQTSADEMTIFNRGSGILTSSPLRPYLWAIEINLCGRKVPSVSMYKALPSAPPFSSGSWHVTQSWWQIWVLPAYVLIRFPTKLPTKENTKLP